MARTAGRVALVVPTLNEEDAIGPTLARVPRDLVDEVIVADGGSRDRTRELAAAAGASVVDAGRGYGRACLEGARAAGEACEIVAFMDGDGSDEPAELGRLLDPIRGGTHDLVLASRTRGTRAPGSMGVHQVVAGRAVGWGTRLLYGVAYTDMCAFRAIRRDVLLGLGMREMTYGWNLEMQMRAARAGLRITEVPVPYGRRVGGASKVAGSLSGTVRAGSRIVTTFLRIALEPAAPTPTTARSPS